MDKLDFRFEIKEMAGETGTFTGIASSYGKLDLANDVVMHGAFAKTLKDRDSIPILYQHDQREPIGKGRLEDTPDGLLIHGKLSLTSNPTAQKAYALLKDEVLRGLSIGYEVVRKDVKSGIRYLKEIKLFEVSLVTFPCCEQALVSGVKSIDGREEIDELKSLFLQYRIQHKGLQV